MGARLRRLSLARRRNVGRRRYADGLYFFAGGAPRSQSGGQCMERGRVSAGRGEASMVAYWLAPPVRYLLSAVVILLRNISVCRPVSVDSSQATVPRMTESVAPVCWRAQLTDHLPGSIPSSKKEVIMRKFENTVATVFAFGLLAGSWGFLFAIVY